MKNGLFIALIAIAVLLAFPASSALAGKTSAVVNGKSYHFNSRYDWYENNYGFGIKHEFKQWSAWKKIAMASGFRDGTSKDRFSLTHLPRKAVEETANNNILDRTISRILLK